MGKKLTSNALKKLLVLLFCIICNHVNAQDTLATYFGEEQIIISNEMGDGKAIHTADINQDGLADVIVGSQNGIYIHLNEGNGMFAERIKVNSKKTYTDVSVFLAIDFDGDSDIDIIAGENWNGIFFYENYGELTFKPAVKIHFESANHMAADDIDGDGKMEIVSSSGRGSYVRITHFEAPDSVRLEWIKAGNHFFSNLIDMDSDGDKDIAVILEEEQNLVWYENVGDSIRTTYKQMELGTNLREIYVQDFDNDGDDDMVLRGYNGVSFFSHISDSTFQYIKGSSVDYTDVPIHLADLDGDGTSNLMYTKDGASYGLLNIVYGGHFPLQYTVSSNISDLIDITSGDLNNDGLVDVLGITENYGLAFWHQNLGNNSFSDKKFISRDLYNQNNLKVIDLNNDGTEEVVVLSGLQARISYFNYREGNGWVQNDIDTKAENSNAMIIDDYNNDGLVDLIYPSYLANSIYKRNNLGNMEFSDPELIIEMSSPYKIFSKDFNNDGQLDILTGYRFSTDVSYRLNISDSDGGFNSHYLGFSYYYMDKYFLIADINDDSLADLIVPSRYGDPIAVYVNQDGETFSYESLEYANKLYISDPSDLAFEDIDGDGQKDLVISYRRGEVSWLKLLSDGSYSRTLIEEGEDSNFLDNIRLFLHDFDQDGDLDILKGMHQQDKMKFLINDGQANFKDGGFLNGRVGSYSEVAIMDVDNDKDDDIIVNDYYNNELSWFENTSLNVSTEQEPIDQIFTSKILGNYPNPFNPTTNVVFELEKAQAVQIRVFDVTGRLVKESGHGFFKAGRNQITLKIFGLSSGMYFYQVIGQDFIQTSKFTIIK